MSDVLANLAAVREALERWRRVNLHAEDSGGESELQQSKEALAALSVVEGEWRNTVPLTVEEAEQIQRALWPDSTEAEEDAAHELLASRVAAGPGDKQ